ncbi:hypothetical protein CAEBREN_00137 [Caenorhabditis brenneri]|uniref:DUF38 domain-containing protein n=1 Tax=Caenorhabditis brenneri TaxID=135651 RepID=G0NXN0_CAEBE|nr:hypothetical protein CAEBREN_00137 [Caenorhabditis brenneri]
MTLLFYGKSVGYLYPDNQAYELVYRNINGENTEIDWWREDGDRVKTIEKSNCVDLCIRDFASIFESKLPTLSRLYIDCNENGYKRIQKALESSAKTPMKVEFLYLVITSQEDAMEILPFICPKALHYLRIRGTAGDLDLSKVVETEQWKKAKQFTDNRPPVRAGIHNFENFETASVLFDELTTEDVRKVKESFLNCSSTTKYLKIFSRHFPDRNGLIELLGRPYRYRDRRGNLRRSRWFFRRPTKRVLVIELSEDPQFIDFKIHTLAKARKMARALY